MLTGLLLVLVAVYSGDRLLVTGELYEGNQCHTSKGPGVCQLLNEKCQSVYNDLLSGKEPELLCGYRRNLPIVCCPGSRSPTSTSTSQPIWDFANPNRKPTWNSQRPTTTDSNNWGNNRQTTTSSYNWINNRPTSTEKYWETTSRPNANNDYNWGNNRPTSTGNYWSNNVRPSMTTENYWGNNNRPTTNTPTATSRNPLLRNVRPARRMCAEYAKSVYALIDTPTLIAGDRPPVNESLCAIKERKLIVGGTKAEPKEFPHSAVLGKRTGSSILWYCGGTLISDKFVLTAAHCVFSSVEAGPQMVRVGDLNLERTDDNAKPQDRRVIEKIRHPNYKPPSKYHDIALLRLESPVKFDAYVRPACLDVKGNHPVDEKVVATGWGLIDPANPKGSDDLLKVTLRLVSHEKCSNDFLPDGFIRKGILEESQFCAFETDKDTCQGDSGGPLVVYSSDEECMYDIIGITSFGAYCGLSSGVYTKVSHYLPWIEKTVWPNLA